MSDAPWALFDNLLEHVPLSPYSHLPIRSGLAAPFNNF